MNIRIEIIKGLLEGKRGELIGKYGKNKYYVILDGTENKILIDADSCKDIRR